jgi:hypothetical protein
MKNIQYIMIMVIIHQKNNHLHILIVLLISQDKRQKII